MILSSLDLNLLLTLDTVLQERSVARAARRLHVTPSAISNALARLRTALRDPLVLRRGRGIVPTPRAQELGPALGRAMAELERALATEPFDAASCARTFTLALADAGQVAWLPRLASALSKAMPQARLRVIGIDSLLSLGDLSSPEVDLHVGVRAHGAGIHHETLFDERLVLVARKRHPACAARLSRRKLAELRHVAVDMTAGRVGRDAVTLAYARARLPRNIALSVPTFAAAAAVAAESDLVATLPASLHEAQRGAQKLDLVSGPAPRPNVTMTLCWHERTQADPALAALRDLVCAVLRPDAPRSGP